jgi:hypothetical protein
MDQAATLWEIRYLIEAWQSGHTARTPRSTRTS